MTRTEEIKAKAGELGQSFFPDECNVWARANIEAKFVSSACIEMAEWMQEKMIDKACAWLKEYGDDFGVPESESGRVYVDDLVCEFRKAMEE